MSISTATKTPQKDNYAYHNNSRNFFHHQCTVQATSVFFYQKVRSDRVAFLVESERCQSQWWEVSTTWQTRIETGTRLHRTRSDELSGGHIDVNCKVWCVYTASAYQPLICSNVTFDIVTFSTAMSLSVLFTVPAARYLNSLSSLWPPAFLYKAYHILRAEQLNNLSSVAYHSEVSRPR